jgi:hypothetical protein
MKKAFTPEDALRDIAHDYAYLVAAGQDTQKPLPHPFNHYAERTFLIHCRTFDEFFNGRKHAMPITDFADGFAPPPITDWDTWGEYINMHLAHLTKGRVMRAIMWTGSANKQLLVDFQKSWAEFYRCLKPHLEPMLRAKLKEKEREFNGAISLIP